jgi:hypothetical protein
MSNGRAFCLKRFQNRKEWREKVVNHQCEFKEGRKDDDDIFAGPLFPESAERKVFSSG